MRSMEDGLERGMRVASLVKICAHFNLELPDKNVAKGGRVQVAAFITEKCLSDARFKADALSEDQVVIAMVVLIAIGDPISQFVPEDEDGDFEKLTFAAALQIFWQKTKTDFPRLFKEASAAFGKLANHKQHAIIVRTVGKAVWQFLHTADARDLVPITDTFRMMLSSVELR
jgi:hypothetical protein